MNLLHATYYTVGENIIVTTKYEIIMLPSTHLFFQYCDIGKGIALPSIAIAIVVALSRS